MTFFTAELPLEFATELNKYFVMPEAECLKALIELADQGPDEQTKIQETARQLVETVRQNNTRPPLINTFLQEYGLSTEEGVTLMRLSEALIRTPDKWTAFKLIRDKLEPGDWAKHSFKSHSKMVDFATFGLELSKGWIKSSGGIRAENLAARMGDNVLHTAVFRVMAMMGDHYVLGKNIEHALKTARRDKDDLDSFSFDMLGEAAKTRIDADRYFASYMIAIQAIADVADKFGEHKPGLSVKLSALHPRYEYAQRHKCLPFLVDRFVTLAQIAKPKNLRISIDAEEADRLELSLLFLKNLLEHDQLQDWDELGFVVQAYHRRTVPVIRQLIRYLRENNRKINVRLVKGAYWDSEIKHAQEAGMESYPVYTRKENTDVSYIACARLLLEADDVIYPCFATHNAQTAAEIIHMAGDKPYEFQRLHGMGKLLHEALKAKSGRVSRIYAPVGKHSDLLPYLVRRLLENGANSSFVNQLTSEDISADEIIADPVSKAALNKTADHPSIIEPRVQFEERLAAPGFELTQAVNEIEIRNVIGQYTRASCASIIDGQTAGTGKTVIPFPADTTLSAGHFSAIGVDDTQRAIQSAKNATSLTPKQRRDAIRKLGDLLCRDYNKFLSLCVMEAGKTWNDAIAEVREAIDFCYYYADQVSERPRLGVVACISPWNFPLAIFLGQIAGALAAGNSVVAKPAPQTPLIAYEAAKLIHEAGIPADAFHLLIGDGAEIGSFMTAHRDVDGICFTGSTHTAKLIYGSLINSGRASVPLIAETGGINVMIIDSTALLEQGVTDVIASAFQSAGQRCSACRIVCVQDDIADSFIKMLSGAMKELVLGDPRDPATDIGPVIDAGAQAHLQSYIEGASKTFKKVGETPIPADLPNGYFVQPVAFEVEKIADIKQEIFGPVLHIVRFDGDDLTGLINDINATGFGLTMGLHTRIDDRIDEIAAMAKVGNLYVNRNQIGAVVGVQPFGGEGLSGTGPKAGGPAYVNRLSRHRMEKSAGNPSSVSALLSAMSEIGLEPNAAIVDNVTEFMARHEEVSVLPGPTGETNTLKVLPRGRLYCPPGEDLADRIFVTLATGNICVLNAGTEIDGIEILPNLELSPELYQFVQGVVVPAGKVQTTAELIHWKGGPILPIFTPGDDPERFFLERTLTINTSAAGGNATLLAL